MDLGNLKGFGELAIRGLLTVNAPKIFNGLLNEFLRREKLGVSNFVTLVTEKQSLWALLPEERYSTVKRALSNVGDLDWLTTEWMINAIKKEHPAVASLFLSWKKGRTWLDRQVKDVKEKIETEL